MGWLVNIVWSFCASAVGNRELSGGHSVWAKGAGFVVVPFVEKPGSESGVGDKERSSTSDVKLGQPTFARNIFRFRAQPFLAMCGERHGN
jgi:hypothetical protein